MRKLIFILLALLTSAADAQMIKCKHGQVIFLQSYPCASDKPVEVETAPVANKNGFRDPTKPPESSYAVTGNDPVKAKLARAKIALASGDNAQALTLAQQAQRMAINKLSAALSTPRGHASEDTDGITLSSLAIKKDHIDYFGDQWIVFKATIRNDTSDERKIYLKYNGIDNAGFLVKDIRLHGTVPAHSSKSLTNKDYLKPSELIRIQKWVLDK